MSGTPPHNGRRAETAAELGSLVDAALLDAEKWWDVSRFIHEALGAKVTFQVVDIANADVPISVGAGWSAEAGSLYARHYWTIDPFNPALAAIRTTGFLHSSEIVPDALLRRTEFHADFLRPEGEADSSSVLLLGAHREERAVFAVASDGRHAERRHAEIRSLMEPLVPRMRRALAVNRLSRRRFAPGRATLLDGFLDPAMLLDEEVRLIGANAAAEALIEARRGWQIGPADRLQLVLPGPDRMLGDLVRSACASRLDRRARTGLSVDLGSGESWSLTCLPLSPAATGLLPAETLGLGTPRRAALLVVRPVEPLSAGDVIERLRARFALTRSEALLVVELQRGGTLAAVADRLGISRATAQTHLRAAFQKTGTSRQKDLLVRIQADDPADPSRL